MPQFTFCYFTDCFSMPSTRALICDSIPRFIPLMIETDIFCFRGARIIDLIALISSNPLAFCQYETILVHCGTNDIQSVSCEDILKSYKSLVDLLHLHCPYAHILLSAILPRSIDDDKTGASVKFINSELRTLSITLGFHLIPSFRVVLHAGKIQGALFCKDKLHLSCKGIYLLHQLFCSHLSKFNSPSTQIQGSKSVFKRHWPTKTWFQTLD